eukprot:12664901-Alexandrium_andersonii.AAC.1
MSASLVGSEMCIRDSVVAARQLDAKAPWGISEDRRGKSASSGASEGGPCLLYTSDAADDM